MSLIAGSEQRVQELRADDNLVSNVARPEMLGRDRADRGFDWLCHASSGLRGRILGERERLVAAVPLLDEFVFLASIRRCRRWQGVCHRVVEDGERSVGWIRLLLSFDPLDERLVSGFLERQPVFPCELAESFVLILGQLGLDVLGVVTLYFILLLPVFRGASESAW